MITYILFMQINYPALVRKFLSSFDIFDLDLFPNIIPEYKYYMKAPKGFE